MKVKGVAKKLLPEMHACTCMLLPAHVHAPCLACTDVP